MLIYSFNSIFSSPVNLNIAQVGGAQTEEEKKEFLRIKQLLVENKKAKINVGGNSD